jgi:arsenite methyltransferase
MDPRIAQLKNLTMAERVRLLGHPAGPLGAAMGDYMNALNGRINDAVYGRLRLPPDARVLEIGCGNGKLLPQIMALAPGLVFHGIDISEAMVSEAAAFNRELLAAGRAAFRCASSTAIPFEDVTFDRAVAINVTYFWPEPVRDLAEIRRVLKPDGLLAVASLTPEGAAHLVKGGEPFRAYPEAELRALFVAAGFRTVDVEDYREITPQPDGSTVERSFHIVLAGNGRP